ncbi:MAG: hypothetical protein ABIU54_00880 [Candidatus Eisenbacteria bacterium]
MHAEAPVAAGSTASFVEWWSAPGRPGWVSDGHTGIGLPLSFAGLVRGGWWLQDSAAPWAAPPPGLVEAQPPLAWADSASVVLGEDSAWEGFGGGIVRARTFFTPSLNMKPRAVFTFVNGSSAIERNSLFLTRSDRRHWLRIGSTGQRRGGVGALNLSAEHLWTVDGGLRRGAHTLRTHFTQRGLGASLRYPLTESGRGESGELGYDWARGEWRSMVTLERGWDGRVSSDASLGSTFREGRRDAQQTRIVSELTHTRGDHIEAVRLWARQGRVVRRYSDGERTVWDERALWAASRVERPWQWGTLEMQLGGGWSDASRRNRERAQLAPGLAWRHADDRVQLRLFTERVLDPIWSDLSPSARPFVQNTWVGGLQVGTGSIRRRWIEGALLLGRTGNKATLVPYPLRDIQLRIGYQSESRAKEFALATLEAGIRGRVGSLEVSTFALARDRDGQRWIDPGTGARLAAETGFSAFTGDLGVRLRLETAYVGARETDIGSSIVGGFDEEVLPAFATLAASVAVTLGDATIVVRADDLEDERRPQVWLDLLTGRPALGTGRQLRASLIWPFFN